MFLVGDISKIKNQVVLKSVRLYKLELSNLYSLTVHSGTSAKDSTLHFFCITPRAMVCK